MVCNFSARYFSTLRSHKSLEKRSESRLSYHFAHLHLLSSLIFSLLFFSSLTLRTSAFPTVHIVGSFTSKLPSINIIPFRLHWVLFTGCILFQLWISAKVIGLALQIAMSKPGKKGLRTKYLDEDVPESGPSRRKKLQAIYDRERISLQLRNLIWSNNTWFTTSLFRIFCLVDCCHLFWALRKETQPTEDH